jgi:hypothetical protein
MKFRFVVQRVQIDIERAANGTWRWTDPDGKLAHAMSLCISTSGART